MTDSVCMPCSIKFSMTLQTEIHSTKTSDFLKPNNYSQVIQFLHKHIKPPFERTQILLFDISLSDIFRK